LCPHTRRREGRNHRGRHERQQEPNLRSPNDEEAVDVHAKQIVVGEAANRFDPMGVSKFGHGYWIRRAHEDRYARQSRSNSRRHQQGAYHASPQEAPFPSPYDRRHPHGHGRKQQAVHRDHVRHNARRIIIPDAQGHHGKPCRTTAGPQAQGAARPLLAQARRTHGKAGYCVMKRHMPMRAMPRSKRNNPRAPISI